MRDRHRHWNTDAQEWIYGADVSEALDAAQLAITEYYNGDRAWAERWLLNACAANRNPKEKAK